VKFDELDVRLRAFETQKETRVPEGSVVARLDGRGFTRLTKESLALEKTFDYKFHLAMSVTLTHLMGCGFAVRLGYSQSDEISLFFEPAGIPFDRKNRKVLSVLAGEASAAFTLAMGVHGVFDCRLSVLPDEASVFDYFRWRQMDASRNALSAHCYWVSRREGLSPRAATARWDGASQLKKRGFLAEHEIDFEKLPLWQTRGFAAWWESHEKEAIDRQTGLATLALRKRLVIERELEFGDEFAGWMREKI
jgi:tRNA(His) 5'-end guanylyltransferase